MHTSLSVCYILGNYYDVLPPLNLDLTISATDLWLLAEHWTQPYPWMAQKVPTFLLSFSQLFFFVSYLLLFVDQMLHKPDVCILYKYCRYNVTTLYFVLYKSKMYKFITNNLLGNSRSCIKIQNLHRCIYL